jgi:hypothetical protein
VSENYFQAQCTLCRKKFAIGHGGRNDLTVHATSDFHICNVKAAHCSSVLSFFVKPSPTGIDKQVCNALYTCYVNGVMFCVVLEIIIPPIDPSKDRPLVNDIK